MPLRFGHAGKSLGVHDQGGFWHRMRASPILTGRQSNLHQLPASDGASPPARARTFGSMEGAKSSRRRERRAARPTCYNSRLSSLTFRIRSARRRWVAASLARIDS